MKQPPTEAVAPSRRGRFPSPRISLTIGVMEIRRFARRVRAQDVWMLMMGIGSLAVLLMVPVLFGFAYEFGEELVDEPAIAGTSLTLIVVIAWPVMVLFGLVSGVSSEGEIRDQEGVLAIRPPKDVAGGLLVYIWLGYAPFVLIPGLAGAIGLAAGMGEPLVPVGIVLALACLLVTGTLVGYAIGLVLKGVIRRSPWLSRLKPVFGVVVVVGYFWLVFTDQVWPILTDVGEVLDRTPLVWYVDLALVSTPGVDVSPTAASTILVISVAILPAGVLAVVRAGEYAWYVDVEGAEEVTDGATGPTVGERLDRALGSFGVHPATRGVAVAVLIRGYRAPLQLVYVAIPFLFLIPVLDPIVRTGAVPEWFPWMVITYAGWAAGASVPLNILGNQGSTLPRLLTSPTGGRRIVRGHLLATAIAFGPLTVALGVLTGHLAGRSTPVIASVGVGGVAVVIAGSTLAAGIGTTFPRFSTIDLTDSTAAALPSKLAFGLLSLYAVLAANSIGLLVDEVYRMMIASLLAGVLPYGMSVSEGQLETGAMAVAIVGILALPLAYYGGARRIDAYRVS